MGKQSKAKTAISIEEAWKLFNLQKFDDALAVFNELLSKGKNEEALYGRACALFRTSDFEAALNDLTALIKQDNHSLRYMHSRALIYGANEQYDKAVKDMQKLSGLFPDNGEVLCDLGGLYLIMEEYNKARECFERSADIDKSCPCAWFGKGMVALFHKEHKKAVEYFNIAIKLDAKHKLSYMARAEALFHSGKKSEALKDIKKTLNMDKGFFDEFKEFLPSGDEDSNDTKEGRQKQTLDDEDAMDVY